MIKSSNIYFGASLLVAISLSGCTYLPKSGPDAKSVDRDATIKVTTQGRRAGIDYVLVDITAPTVSYFQDTSGGSLVASFGLGPSKPADITLGYGDVVQVSIFESQSGGLFIPSDAGSRAGNYVTVPSQTIDRSGTITVPYAGTIQAAGRRKEAIEAEIVKKLGDRAIEPQVVITTVASSSSEVAVLGDVNGPKRIELTSAGERVLDAISEAGGLTSPALETNIILHRNGITVTVPYETLLRNPAENIYVMPHDTIYADHRPRTFVAFGATELPGRYTFDNTNLSLADGMGKAGGASDSKANPAQVLLYRAVDRKILQRMNINVSAFANDKIPTIFRANLRDPSGFFAAQKFQLADGDVLYIENAGSVELTKFLDLANSVTSTAAGTTSDAVTTKRAVRDLN